MQNYKKITRSAFLFIFGSLWLMRDPWRLIGLQCHCGNNTLQCFWYIFPWCNVARCFSSCGNRIVIHWDEWKQEKNEPSSSPLFNCEDLCHLSWFTSTTVSPRHITLILTTSRLKTYKSSLRIRKEIKGGSDPPSKVDHRSFKDTSQSSVWDTQYFSKFVIL